MLPHHRRKNSITSDSSSSSDDGDTKSKSEDEVCTQQTKLISELKPNETNWSSKLIVASKQSPKKGDTPEKKHQTMTLIDTKMNTIRGIIFHRDVEPLNNTLQLGKTYMISNALVREEKLNNTNVHGALSLTFKQGTEIETLAEDNSSLIEALYSFTMLKDCSAYLGTTTELSVAGIVLHVSEKETIANSYVRNVTLIDKSMEIMRIIMWANFADHESLAISAVVRSKPVIVAVNLVVRAHQDGIVLSTKTTSCVFLNPSFAITKELCAWREDQMSMLRKLARTQKKNPTIKTIPPPTEDVVKTLTEFIRLMHGESRPGNCWVKSSFAVENFDQHFTYVGCEVCKKGAAVKKNEIFICYTCEHKKRKAVPWLRVNIVLTDGENTVDIIVFGNAAKNLFKCDPTEVLQLIEQGPDRDLLRSIFKSDEGSEKLFYLNYKAADESSSQQQKPVANQVYDANQMQQTPVQSQHVDTSTQETSPATPPSKKQKTT